MSQTFDLPQSFRDKFLDHHELAAKMSDAFGIDITEAVMLGLCSAGKTPVGVNLQPIVGVPLLVWDRVEIATWEAMGFPLPDDLIEREATVRMALSHALAESGRSLPDAKVVHPAELN